MVRDANEIAQQYERRERDGWRSGLQPDHPRLVPSRRRYGRVLAHHGDEELSVDGEFNFGDHVSLQIIGDGLLLVEDEDGLRTIINSRKFFYIEFRPSPEPNENDEGE